MPRQGERYRIVPPARSPRTVIGQGPRPDRYRATVNGTVVEDIHGDVISCSENIDYPAGKVTRHPRWIEQHPERFELIE